MSSVKAPVPLKDALAAWIARKRVGPEFELARTVVDWPQLVGPQIAAVARPRAVARDGTLLVVVANHAWATELGMMTPQILARLNRPGRERVQHIRWQVGPLDGP